MLQPPFNPKKLNSSTFSIITLSILSVRYCISLLGTWKIIYFYLFSDDLFIFNHSITLESSAFIKYSLVSILFPKDAKLLNSVVSSAYNEALQCMRFGLLKENVGLGDKIQL